MRCTSRCHYSERFFKNALSMHTRTQAKTHNYLYNIPVFKTVIICISHSCTFIRKSAQLKNAGEGRNFVSSTFI